MATLVVEDGTGKPNANSFASDSQFTAWLKDRGVADLKTGGERIVALIQGGDYLLNERRLPWRGTKKTSTQRMPYPRTGVVEYRGQAIGDTEIPFRLTEAQMELGRMVLSGVTLQPRQVRGNAVQTKTIGPLSTTYFKDAPTEDVFPFVVGILAPLLLCDDALLAVPYQAGPETVVGYDNEYHPFSETDGTVPL